MGNNKVFPILKLPDELICEILSYLPKQDMLLNCLVCKKFFGLLYGLCHGVFEFNIKDANFANILRSILECQEISGFITHFIVTHPHDSTDTCVKKITSPTEKRMLILHW